MEKTRFLDRKLEQEDFDGFMIHDDSSNSNLYYLTDFEAPDAVTYLRTEGKSIMLVSPLEKSRADEEAQVDEVVSTSSYKKGDNRDDEKGQKEILVQFLEDYGIENLSVPADFPLEKAENLRERNLTIEPVEDQVMEARKIKSEKEIENLREVQETTEEVMEKARSFIEKAEVKDGKLHLEGEPLTSERMKKEIKLFLIDHSCEVPEETIVACGKDSAKPHSTGSGGIEAGKPIVIDIFPRHRNRYFGDMTRTFVKGEASEELKEMKQAVLEAQESAFEALEQGAGVKASEVHDRVCNVLENHGYNTLRNGDGESGFIHSTGHAVGLDLHEPPRIADNDDELKAGMILTIEPGLYLPDIGGVRLEDMILVKEDGYENFNSMDKEMEIK